MRHAPGELAYRLHLLRLVQLLLDALLLGEVLQEAGEEFLAIDIRLADVKLHGKPPAILPEPGNHAADADNLLFAGALVLRDVAVMSAAVRLGHEDADILPLRFLGAEADTKIGTDLGLTNEWAYNIIKGVGNYGEVFERNIGTNTPLKIERGVNALWTKGGLQYAPPIR